MPYAELTEHVLSSRTGAYERKVWASSGRRGSAEAAVVFLDGELYVERVKAPGVVQGLEAAGVIPATLAVYVSIHSGASRHVDFVCDPAYAEFVAADVVGWVRSEAPTVRDVVIAGLSLSGLAAGYAATRHPSAFRAAVCQSPSFWWDGGRFGKEVPPAQPSGPAFWVCVGDGETQAGVSHPPSGLYQAMTQIEGCDRAGAALRAKGYDVSYRRYAGGHDPECWREDLGLALAWVWR